MLEDPLPEQMRKQLVVKIISGQQLPKPKDSMLGDRGEVSAKPKIIPPSFSCLLFFFTIVSFSSIFFTLLCNLTLSLQTFTFVNFFCSYKHIVAFKKVNACLFCVCVFFLDH